ncbi:MAG: hypothetical protein ABW185_07805, partial [Sedimenticola sp.]
MHSEEEEEEEEDTLIDIGTIQFSRLDECGCPSDVLACLPNTENTKGVIFPLVKETNPNIHLRMATQLSYLRVHTVLTIRFESKFGMIFDNWLNDVYSHVAEFPDPNATFVATLFLTEIVSTALGASIGCKEPSCFNTSIPDINTDWDITMKPGEYIHTVLTRDEEKWSNLLAAGETTKQMEKKNKKRIACSQAGPFWRRAVS